MEWLGVDRRRLGTGMLVFGLAGMVIAGIVAVSLALGAVAARNLDDRLAADQARIAQSLTRLSTTMESLARTTDNAGTTLGTTSEALQDAELILRSTESALLALSDALDISILGNQPFLSASQRMAELAATVGQFQGRAGALASNLDQNAADVASMADQVRLLTTDVDDLARRVAGFDRIGDLVGLLIGGIVLGALLTAWVAIAAAGCAWAGWRLRAAGSAEMEIRSAF
jgi:hypothetical protein